MDSITGEDKFKGRALSSSTAWFSSTLNVSARVLFITKGFFVCFWCTHKELQLDHQLIPHRPPKYSPVSKAGKDCWQFFFFFLFFSSNLKILLFYNINDNLIQQDMPRIQDSSCTSEQKWCIKARAVSRQESWWNPCTAGSIDITALFPLESQFSMP